MLLPVQYVDLCIKCKYLIVLKTDQRGNLILDFWHTCGKSHCSVCKTQWRGHTRVINYSMLFSPLLFPPSVTTWPSPWPQLNAVMCTTAKVSHAIWLMQGAEIIPLTLPSPGTCFPNQLLWFLSVFGAWGKKSGTSPCCDHINMEKPDRRSKGDQQWFPNGCKWWCHSESPG